jgi:hypothetical protein
MMTRDRTLFKTGRSRLHQQFALDAAPLDVVMLRPIFELCIDDRKQG